MQCVTAKWWINISILKRCVALDTLESKQLVMFKTLEVSTPCAAWTGGCSDECQGNFLKGPCSICYQSFGMHLGVKSIFLANCSRNNCKNPFTITEKIVPSHLWITGESCTLSQRERGQLVISSAAFGITGWGVFCISLQPGENNRHWCLLARVGSGW